MGTKECHDRMNGSCKRWKRADGAIVVAIHDVMQGQQVAKKKNKRLAEFVHCVLFDSDAQVLSKYMLAVQ